MANWSNPTLSSTYTNFLSELKARDEDLAKQFDGTTSSNLATGTIRWNSTTNRWQKWSGSAWAELTGTYALTALTTTGNASIGGTLAVTGATTLAAATATTPTTGDNSTAVATTAYVRAQAYAPLASPALTGTPTVPSAAVDTNTTQAASTAFVLGQAGSAAPVINGTAAVGSSLRYSRQDHVHPIDTSRAATGQAMHVGTTALAINRASAAQTLTGVSIDGNAATATSTPNPTFSNDSVSKDNITTRTETGFYETNTGTLAEGWPTNSGGFHHLISCTHLNDANYYALQLSSQFGTQDLYFRNTNGSGTQAWSTMLHSNNFNSYAPTLNGGGASGTWGVSVTGNAGTATTLATARTLTIGSTGKTFNGSANVSWTAAEILLSPVPGNWFRGYLSSGSDGVTELGRFLDFHATNTSGNDYDARLECTGVGAFNFTGATVTAGTFVGALTGNAATVTTNANLTGHITSVGNAAVLGSFTSAQLAGALTDETGTGANVFATSPTLVTPVLGVATGTSFNSITGLSSTNPTALGAVAVGTGTTTARADHVHPTTGLGLTSGTLAQFAATTSAQLAGVVSDETGSGALVFATSPTLVTPALGTPSSGNLANCTSINATNISSGTLAEARLPFQPIQQGGGTGQGTNKIYVGWGAGSVLRLQIDSTDFGATWPIGVSGNAATVTTNANLTGDITSVGNATAIASGVIVNADINASAAIADTKLATISTAGKVSGTAITSGDIATSGNLEITSATPSVRLTESDGTATHSQTVLLRNGNDFVLQTRSSTGLALSDDYRVPANASGATDHIWRIGNTEKARLDSTGALLVGTTAEPTGVADGDIALQNRLVMNAAAGNYGQLQRIVDTGANLTATTGTIVFKFKSAAPGSARSAYVKINLSGRSNSNTLTQHPVCEYAFQLHQTSGGVCSINGATTIFEYTFLRATHLAFVDLGSGECTVTLTNPTGSAITPAYMVEINTQAGTFGLDAVTVT